MNTFLIWASILPFVGSSWLRQRTKQRTSALDAGSEITPTEEMPTGILCREPGRPGEKDIEVILGEGNRRDLAFSKLIMQDGVELGRESAGIQTTVQCTGHAPLEKCVPEPSNPPRCSSTQLAGCTCKMDEEQLPPLPYQKQMIAAALPVCEKSLQDHFRILMIGLGGGAMATYLHNHCSRAVIDSVEPDARMIHIAQHFLGFSKGKWDVVEENYGLQALQERVAAKGPRYDLIMVDCFDGGHIPEGCRSQAFVTAVRDVLKTGSGILLQNGLFPAANDLMNLYNATFGVGHVSSAKIVSQASWNGTMHSQRIIEARALSSLVSPPH